MKIWIDMQSPPDVQFFRPFIKEFQIHNIMHITARDYAETTDMLKRFHIEYFSIGAETSSSVLMKTYNTIARTLKLSRNVKDFDVNFALGNLHSIYISKLRKKTCINFMDNELGLKKVQEKRSLFEYGVIKSQTLLANYIIVPSVFPVEALVADGMNKEHIFTFDGYKEDIYIADFEPDASILNELPFDEFILVRPESSAIYKERIPSLVPLLVTSLVKEGFNIVYLPRVHQDSSYVNGIKNVFIPKKALNGLDLCYYSTAVLSGSGTLTREACCMGKKAISFFPNKKLLAVDQSLVQQKKLLHTRDIDKIMEYIVHTPEMQPNLKRCKNVKESLFLNLKKIVDGIKSV